MWAESIMSKNNWRVRFKQSNIKNFTNFNDAFLGGGGLEIIENDRREYW